MASAFFLNTLLNPVNPFEFSSISKSLRGSHNGTWKYSGVPILDSQSFPQRSLAIVSRKYLHASASSGRFIK
jgi:hypothetical protein